MHWLHKREVLALAERLIFEEGEHTLTEAKSTRRRHTVFEHLDEIPLRHHRLIITTGEECLLCFEPCALIERIIEL